MKILFVIHILSKNGAAIAMYDLICGLKNKYPDLSIMVFARFAEKEDVDFFNEINPIKVGDEIELLKELSKNNYDLIHWFRTKSALLFNRLFDKRYKHRKIPPSIITHCQILSDHGLRLNFKELRYASFFVFICKTAYEHPYHKCIEEMDREMVYFGCGGMPELEKAKKKENHYDNHSKLIFGRGSNINEFKIPYNLISSISPLKNENFQLIIVGSGDKSMLKKEITKYGFDNKVQLKDQMLVKDWYQFLANIDVYFYLLPKNSYSALDATIQQAMLFSKPVIYKGPKAPAELIEHGVSGFIARNGAEVVRYSKLLISDLELRKEIGHNARKRILEKFRFEDTIVKYREVYDMIKGRGTTQICQTHRNLPIRSVMSYIVTSLVDKIQKRIISIKPWL